MKGLAIIGSPKGKGTSYKVTRKIEEKLESLEDDVEFDYLFLRDANLALCRGCFTSIPKGEDLCPLKDARVKIEEQISNSGETL